jgi:16S rRNA (guanine(966)-N(2))-methyltransferase RsmD
MRVIAGSCRGRKLFAPAGVTTRPTSDRVKEALFSILASRADFAAISVLDICAGTGSLGIEALSRGAGSCCFIEYNPSVKAILDKNLAVTGFEERAEVLIMEATAALRKIALGGRRFDLVFFDPPYSSELYRDILEMLGSSELLTAGAILVAECATGNRLEETYGRLVHFDRRVYGDTALELYELEE